MTQSVPYFSRSTDNPRLGTTVEYSLMAALDRSLRVTAANAEMIRQFGGADVDICGAMMSDLLGPSVRGKVRCQLQHLIEGQQDRFDEYALDLLTPDGSITADVTGTSISRGRGQVDGVLVLVRPHAQSSGSGRRRGPARQLSGLEARILKEIATGASTVQMAASLFLSRGGVEYHMTSLMRRMRAKNRAALISKAYSLGYFELGSWPPQIVADVVNGELPARSAG